MRDPIEHFISGFTEISFRYKLLSHESGYSSSLYSFPTANVTEMPQAFIRDLVGGKLHRIKDITDAHSFPQVAFLSGRSYKLSFLGDLGSIDESWKELGRQLQAAHWPRFDHGATMKRGAHKHTDANSGNKHRRRMQSLIGAPIEDAERSSVYRMALCRIHLPDYVCLGYKIPRDCMEIIGPNHGVVCPFDFPRRFRGGA